MATDTASLIPTSVAREVIESASQQSVVLRLARVIQMPEGVMNVPLVSVVPQAEFVASGGRKPLTTIEWSAAKLIPQEIAAVAFIPDQFLDDSGFPVWESVRDEISAAIGRTLDKAVLFGTGAPATFPTGGVSGAGAATTASASSTASSGSRTRSTAAPSRRSAKRRSGRRGSRENSRR
jgi:HK97 family phage major capsid protein